MQNLPAALTSARQSPYLREWRSKSRFFNAAFTSVLKNLMFFALLPVPFSGTGEERRGDFWRHPTVSGVDVVSLTPQIDSFVRISAERTRIAQSLAKGIGTSSGPAPPLICGPQRLAQS